MFCASISKSGVQMKRAMYTCSSALLVSKMTSPFSNTPQPIANAAHNLVSYRVPTMNKHNLLSLATRCFKGTVEKTRAAQD